MFAKICIAALSIAAAVAEPPVNHGYLPPVTGSPGYSYPTPSQPINQPSYQPPPPPPQRPSYGPPTSRPPPPPPPPSYGPPTVRPPPPRPPPTYTPAPSYTPGPSYGPPPPPPRPSYGPPTNDIAFKPGQNNVQQDFAPGTHSGDHDHHDHHHHEPGMPFDFNYAVKDDYYGTDYSHNAVSDGDVVRGEYKVLLPDGRLQIVTYTADWKNGFNADIKYQGEPTYPAPGQTGQNRPTGPSGSGPY
ncbi:hypothetical protein GE061_010243 [Apolygus lucorum]|uniref:Uncharacterized protein n=1 Tax=Apolygus lucorum TaxID=248454 RepID=A0A6A4KG35_APOLU|nr:hypothetical protein GE061_010243 [Apolygus lucorum]